MTSTVRLTLAALAASLLAPAAVLAQAEPPSGTPAFAATPVAAKVLEENRGGFIVVDGITIGFGAVIRTFVDGQLKLQTELTLGPDGLRSTATGGAGGAPSPEAARVLAQLGLDPSGATGAFVSADGATTAVHRITSGQIANLLVNTGDGRDVRQETGVTFVLPGFGAVQAASRLDLAGQRLSDDLSAAAAASVGR